MVNPALGIIGLIDPCCHYISVRFIEARANRVMFASFPYISSSVADMAVILLTICVINVECDSCQGKRCVISIRST